jgi:meiosis-specific protein HOP1
VGASHLPQNWYKANVILGFIAVESTVCDELGVGVTRSHAKKGKKSAKTKTKKQKELQKTKYVFLAKSKRSKAYSDYFNPLREVENCLMGLSDAVRYPE